MCSPVKITVKFLVITFYIAFMKFQDLDDDEYDQEDGYLPRILHWQLPYSSPFCSSQKIFLEPTTESVQDYYNRYNTNNQKESKYLEEVSCTNIPGILQPFNSCAKCRTVTIFNSDVFIIPTNVFKDLNNLEEISMVNVHVNKIETGAFSGLVQLQSIHLEINNISKITRGSFNSLVVLKYLNLSKNAIKEIEDESFHGSTSIEYLDLSYNNLTVLPSGLLKPLNSLRVLNISNNFLYSIESNLCHGLPLEYLIMSENNFTEVDQCIVNLFNLRELSLSNNFISNINGSYFPKFIQTLRLSHNDIFEINEHSFRTHYNLFSLDISANSILYFPNEIFQKLSVLEILDISQNNISKFEADSFFDAFNLKFLNVSGNCISTLDKSTFKNLTQLVTLDLSKNNLNFIQVGVLRPLLNLDMLNISQNQIEYLESGIFNNLKNLRVLDLSLNGIESLEAHIFLPLIHLEILNLANNKLKSLKIHLIIQSFSNLNCLNIDGNSLSCKELAEIFSAKSNTLVIEFGRTIHSENVNGIACEQSTTNIDNNNMADFLNFFQNDFKKSSFVKFFEKFDNSNKNSQLSNEKSNFDLFENLQNKFFENITQDLHSELKDFLASENSTFNEFFKNLYKMFEKIQIENNPNDTDSLYENLQMEMKKLMEFENSSFHLFSEEFTRILKQFESEQIVKGKLFNVLSEPQSGKEKVDKLTMNESFEGFKELNSGTRDLVTVLGQIKFFLVLGIMIVISIYTVKLYNRYKLQCFKMNRNELQAHEMPILTK